MQREGVAGKLLHEVSWQSHRPRLPNPALQPTPGVPWQSHISRALPQQLGCNFGKRAQHPASHPVPPQLPPQSRRCFYKRNQPNPSPFSTQMFLSEVSKPSPVSSQLARTPHLHPAGKVQMGTAAAPKPGWDLSLAGNPPSRASLFALGDSGAGNAIPGLPGGRQQPRKVPARDGSGYGVQGFVSRLKKKKKTNLAKSQARR